MAQQKQLSLKRIKLDKAKARTLVITGIAAFLVVFFLVASVALFKQLTYQNRVITVKKTAVNQLQTNLKARDVLVKSYKDFANLPQNLIGGSPDGNGPNDGGNAKLVLDALPSKYDFPALAASLEKLVIAHNGRITSITGVDDEVAQSAASTEGSPVPVEMPFELSVDGSYIDLQKIIGAMESSIRPFNFNTVQISGDQQDLTLKIEATTYYQPEKTLNIKMETVK